MVKRDSFNNFIGGIVYRRDKAKDFKFINKLQSGFPRQAKDSMSVAVQILYHDKDTTNAFIKFYSSNK